MNELQNMHQLEVVSQLTPEQITSELVASPSFKQQYEYLIALTKYLDDLKKGVDEAIKNVVKEHYYETGESSLSNDGFKYTYIAETTRETFDTKDFKAEHADLYKQYVKVSNVSDSMKVFKVKTEKGTANE